MLAAKDSGLLNHRFKVFNDNCETDERIIVDSEVTQKKKTTYTQKLWH